MPTLPVGEPKPDSDSESEQFHDTIADESEIEFNLDPEDKEWTLRKLRGCPTREEYYSTPEGQVYVAFLKSEEGTTYINQVQKERKEHNKLVALIVKEDQRREDTNSIVIITETPKTKEGGEELTREERNRIRDENKAKADLLEQQRRQEDARLAEQWRIKQTALKREADRKAAREEQKEIEMAEEAMRKLAESFAKSMRKIQDPLQTPIFHGEKKEDPNAHVIKVKDYLQHFEIGIIEDWDKATDLEKKNSNEVRTARFKETLHGKA